MLESFRHKQYDEGLSNTLTQIGTEFSKLPTKIETAPVTQREPQAAPASMHRVQHQPPNSGWNFNGILIVGAIILGGLFLLGMVGRALGRGAGATPGMGMGGGGVAAGPGMGGGGGFGSGLMGGVFGALAGNWLYNSFSGHQGQAFGQNPSDPTVHSGSNEGFGVSNDAGSDFGNGGDFGGGDFGAGDSGVSGGGDVAGGGDF